LVGWLLVEPSGLELVLGCCVPVWGLRGKHNLALKR
jgi:hypothetical protein